jgi:hypothetical protein
LSQAAHLLSGRRNPFHDVVVVQVVVSPASAALALGRVVVQSAKDFSEQAVNLTQSILVCHRSLHLLMCARELKIAGDRAFFFRAIEAGLMQGGLPV